MTTKQPARPLGTDGPVLPRVGYGAMTLDGLYGSVDADDAKAAILRAVENGMMIDTADAYGGGANEERIAAAVAGRRDDAFVATKFGIVFGENETGREFPTGWGLFAQHQRRSGLCFPRAGREFAAAENRPGGSLLRALPRSGNAD